MPRARLIDHLILILGCVLMLGPPALLLVKGFSPSALATLMEPVPPRPDLMQLLTTSLIIAVGVALVKTVTSLLAAFALVFFRVPGAGVLFALLLLPLFLPIESRIMPTMLVTDTMGLLNTYTGLILPVTATGLGTLILRQQLKQLPPEVIEAARLDGAGPWRVFCDFIVPLSLPIIAALLAFFFVLGWNQYLWPLIANPSAPERATVVSGITLLNVGSQASLTLAVVAMLPPLVVFAIAQRWIAKGLAPIRA
ncbi:carbohydrate ABC transporter permease [Jannaschia sp. CCS1]|uniref:carbohydrate ABC transporter permease n=1 Tax=Jannaschia sp. (strain CCS1) TaxID=290400 RepID=UPI000053BA4C|nr:carbohydrate ABC transporter permease [Jannaschia sp. CCS1]ABD55574.1 carbohydrate ABC transporter membrane protein 2, CUT1 family [Jannaschia sp. CCS1]